MTFSTRKGHFCWELTWRPKITHRKRRFLLETIIFRGYVSFKEGHSKHRVLNDDFSFPILVGYVVLVGGFYCTSTRRQIWAFQNLKCWAFLGGCVGFLRLHKVPCIVCIYIYRYIFYIQIRMYIDARLGTGGTGRHFVGRRFKLS